MAALAQRVGLVGAAVPGALVVWADRVEVSMSIYLKGVSLR